MNRKPLFIAADLYGCPNRCLHCWLGHMPSRTMEEGADEWIVSCFRPYFEKITFFSWLREPDFGPHYREQWERDKKLSAGALPPRFELASFWRLVRDPDYAPFLKEVGVSCVQLTFFGLEETTDKYVGRKGAFRELLKATEILLEHEISPRWQAFINEENKEEIPSLLNLFKELELSRRCRDFGGTFRFFVHPGSCEGENRKLYPVRIEKGHIPEELIPYFYNYDSLRPEKEWCGMWKEDPSHVIPHNTEDIVLYAANNYDLFFNFTHMRPEWRIGNLKRDPMDELVRRITEEDIPALREAGRITLGELVRLYGDMASEKAFEEEDYRIYLLNTHLERLYT
ncbi:MAG: radical SAM protein [Lachnospiraceae bacterium]|nr:radical SAM protein [Lachnospiraceae bacterium]